jgi:hypothetical protein
MVKVSSSVKEALLDLARTAVSTSIAVWLGLGISIFDANEDAVKAVIAAGVAAALQVAMKYLDPNNAAYGIVASNIEVKRKAAAAKSTRKRKSATR